MIHLSLKNKLIALVVLAFIFFGTIANVFIFRNIKNTLFEKVKEEVTILSSEKGHRVATIFKGGEDLVKIIAQHNKIIEYLEGDDSEVKLQNKEILDILQNYNIDDAYSAIYIMNPNGQTLVSTDSTFTGKNYNFREYFQKSLAGQPWVYVAIGVTSKKAGYYFSHPIKSLEGNIIGVIVAKMRPNNIHQTFHIDELTKHNRSMLMDKNGVIIYSSDESIVYKSIGKLSKEDLDFIEAKKQFPNIIIESLGYDSISEKICDNNCGNFTVQFFNELNQEEELINVTRINSYPFYLMAEYNLEDLVEVTKRTTTISGIFIGLLAILTIIVILLFVNKFLRPLSDLKKCALEISKDNYSYKYNIKTGDELEELGNTINRMSRKLKKSRESLKQKLTISKRVNKTLVGRELAMRILKKENIDLRKELRNKSK